MATVETDYLIIGAGASGMAFADEVVSGSERDLILVDRRHRPGGHWNDAYPFVRLHQPSAYYGVNSRDLGDNAIDERGPNEGFYQRATAGEICNYYEDCLEDTLLPSGRVRFFGMHEYVHHQSRGHLLVSRLTGETISVSVRRKLVDATYLEPSIPANHTPSFEVAPGVRMVTPDELTNLSEPASGFTLIGAGKTSMDVCNWLLDHGVAADDIRWIRPRDTWTLDRQFWQPLSQLSKLMEGVSLQLEAAANAESLPDLYTRLEACGQFIRLDSDVEPATFRGAISSAHERSRARQVTDVIRKGYVQHIGRNEIVLDEGSIDTDLTHVHVDCTAAGLNQAPVRPVFEPDLITPQWLQWGVFPFSAAFIGFVEISRDDDEEKNRLCSPAPPLDAPAAWVRAFYETQRAWITWDEQPDLQAWLRRSRLNLARGITDHLDDPRMLSALQHIGTNRQSALGNMERLLRATRRADHVGPSRSPNFMERNNLKVTFGRTTRSRSMPSNSVP